MAHKPRLTDLACKYLPVLVALLALINQVIELVSKVVNYGRRILEHKIFLRERAR